MAGIQRLTEREVVYIFGLRDGGLQPTEIANRFGRDKSTISCILQNYSWETFTGLHPRPGATRRTSIRDERMLVRTALSNRTTVLGDITNTTALTISPRTVQRRLKDNGI
jgi:IS30 family transposase